MVKYCTACRILIDSTQNQFRKCENFEISIKILNFHNLISIYEFILRLNLYEKSYRKYMLNFLVLEGFFFGNRICQFFKKHKKSKLYLEYPKGQYFYLRLV